MPKGTPRDEGVVALRREDGVAVLTLQNPPVNVLSEDVFDRLEFLLGLLSTDPTVRVLVLTGAGERAFCAGSNIKEFVSHLERGTFVSDRLRQENDVLAKLAHFQRPTIAAIEGAALGGGLETAVCCDLLVASSTARFALPEVSLGGFPGSGGTVRVQRRIGSGRTKQMMFLGEAIDADTALRWGLVNELTAPGQALARAVEIAQRLARGSAAALAACKRALDQAADLPEDKAIEASLAASSLIESSEDFKAGVAAFVAKTKPIFENADT